MNFCAKAKVVHDNPTSGLWRNSTLTSVSDPQMIPWLCWLCWSTLVHDMEAHLVKSKRDTGQNCPGWRRGQGGLREGGEPFNCWARVRCGLCWSHRGSARTDPTQGNVWLEWDWVLVRYTGREPSVWATVPEKFVVGCFWKAPSGRSHH
jgi:hypothetical protein